MRGVGVEFRSVLCCCCLFFFFSSRRRQTRLRCDWSSDVCCSDLGTDRRLVGEHCRRPGFDQNTRWRPRGNVGLCPLGGRGRHEAAPCFGLGHAATEPALFARPRIWCFFNPGRHKHSPDSCLFALGYHVKPLRGKADR